jgi:hypothetical protein
MQTETQSNCQKEYFELGKVLRDKYNEYMIKRDDNEKQTDAI